MNLDAAQTHIDFLEKGYLNGVHALPTNQSAAALEALPAPSIVSALTTITNNVPTAGPSSSKKASPAEVSHPAKPPRKTRVPKHVVPGVTPFPDPERWLKKRERTSTGRHDGARRRKNAGMGVGATQGSSVADPTPASNTKGGGGSGANPTGQTKKGKKGK